MLLEELNSIQEKILNSWIDFTMKISLNVSIQELHIHNQFEENINNSKDWAQGVCKDKSWTIPFPYC